MAKQKKNQGQLFEDTEESEEHEIDVEQLLNSDRPNKFEFKLELKIKANKMTHSVPVVGGFCYGDRIEEILEKQIKSEWFKTRLRAIIGEPIGDSSGGNEKQTKVIKKFSSWSTHTN